MYFQKPGRKFEKTFGHPVYCTTCGHSLKDKIKFITALVKQFSKKKEANSFYTTRINIDKPITTYQSL